MPGSRIDALALDPGKLTGVARWSPHPPRFKAYAAPYDEALREAERCARFRYTDLIVCEDYQITARTIKTGTDEWRRGQELEFIGVVRFACARTGVEFELQSPSDAKSFATDAKLRAADMWTPGVDHPRDATRHLLLALVKRGVIDPAIFLTD